MRLSLDKIKEIKPKDNIFLFRVEVVSFLLLKEKTMEGTKKISTFNQLREKEIVKYRYFYYN
tara:strand:- start:552 stop:737 length:186 start_codon:yes stop_codon:yes gene_type:complete